MQAFPDAGPLPADQPPPAGRPSAAAHLARQHVPGHAAAQHEQDPRQHRSVGDGLPAGVSSVASATFRQQRLDQRPSRIVDQDVWHA